MVPASHGCRGLVTQPRSQKWRYHWLAAVLTCLGLSGFAALPTVQAAAPVVSLHNANVGFRGYYGKNTWVPVTAQIINHGPATQGKLTISISSEIGASHIAYGNLQWSVSLPAHETVNKQVLVPGFLIGVGSLTLLVNGVSAGTTELTGNALGHVALVAVLSKNTQTAQTLLGSENNTAGAPVLPVTMKAADFPASVDGMSGLTALVSSPQELAGLSRVQQEDVQAWVRLGGLLIITGTQGEVKSWQSWYPLHYTAQHQVSGRGLDQYIGDTSVRAPKLQVHSNANSLQTGASLWAETGAIPLIAQSTQGRGAVVQTAFSPSQPALLAWQGNGALWTTLFKMGSSQSFSAMPNYLSTGGVFSLASASDGLAPLRVPSLGFWASLFGIYVLLAGPVAFFLLRRYKREPAAWVVLPVFSILVTAGIYLFGATQRPTGMLTEATGVLDLVGNGQAEAYGVRAMMSPRVSTFEVQTSQPMLALPLIEHNNPVTEEESASVGRNTTVSFRRVARWGIRYTYLAGAVNGQGEVMASLVNNFGTLAGTLENRTPYLLNNVAVCWNGHIYEVGDLKPGASAAIKSTPATTIKSSNWLAAYSAYNHDITRSIGRSLGALAGSEQLFNSDIGLSSALLVATTAKPTPALGTVFVYEPTASDQTLTLVRQFTDVGLSGEGGVRNS